MHHTQVGRWQSASPLPSHASFSRLLVTCLLSSSRLWHENTAASAPRVSILSPVIKRMASSIHIEIARASMCLTFGKVSTLREVVASGGHSAARAPIAEVQLLAMLRRRSLVTGGRQILYIAVIVVVVVVVLMSERAIQDHQQQHKAQRGCANRHWLVVYALC